MRQNAGPPPDGQNRSGNESCDRKFRDRKVGGSNALAPTSLTSWNLFKKTFYCFPSSLLIGHWTVPFPFWEQIGNRFPKTACSKISEVSLCASVDVCV